VPKGRERSLINIFKKRPRKETRDSDATRTSEQREDSEEFFWAVPKALQVRRWDEQEETFRGFGSPPGRF